MTNPFDQLGEISPFDGDLSGIGSKLKKALKKIDKSAKKVRQKIVPKKVAQLQSKIHKQIRESPIAQNVIATVASVVATPAAGAVIKAGFAAKQYSTARKQQKREQAARAVPTETTPELVVDPVPGRPGTSKRPWRPGGKNYPQTPTPKTVTEDALQYKERIRRKNPKFEDMANTLRSQGADDQQIVDTWTKSDAFVDTARDAVREKGFEQQLISDLIRQGMPAPVAQSYAPQAIDRYTNEVIGTTQQSPWLIGGAVAAGTLALYLLMAPKKRTQ